MVPFEEVEDAEDPLGPDEQLELVDGRVLGVVGDVGVAVEEAVDAVLILRQKVTKLDTIDGIIHLKKNT